MNPQKNRAQTLEKRRLRLIIAIPALLLLFTISSGVINYQIVRIYMASFAKSEFQISVLEDISEYLIIITISLGLLSILFGLGLAYSIIRPIRTLTETFRDIASGNFSRRVSIPNVNEIGDLGDSFNTMVKSLQNLFRERNRYLLESVSGGIITLDVAGNILTMNSTAERIFKINFQEAADKKLLDIVSSKSSSPELKDIIEKAIKDRVTVKNHLIVFSDNDKKRISLSLTISPFKDKNENIMGYLVSFQDVAFVNSLHRRLQHADQLATIGTFATGLAHEIRNPLCSIRSVAQMLKEKFEKDSKESKYSSLIVAETDRLNRLISLILDFSHPDKSPLELCDLNELLSKTLLLSKSNIKSKNISQVKVKENYSPDKLQCPLQKEKMTQAFLNILINAWEAVDEDGEIEISTSAIEDEQKAILVSISNTGSEIPEEDIDKIFDPFYTTKERGTGLGLTISSQIINVNGGTIDVQSNGGKTTFTIKLPIAQE